MYIYNVYYLYIYIYRCKFHFFEGRIDSTQDYSKGFLSIVRDSPINSKDCCKGFLSIVRDFLL